MRVHARLGSGLLIVLAAATAAGYAARAGVWSVPTNAGDHEDLLALFAEWREFQRPVFREGVPDYSAAAMNDQRSRLPGMQARLAAIDPSGWPIPQQVDFHIVRAEMNGLEFDHRVTRPWARMPSFYKVVLPSDTDVPAREGQVMHGAIELWKYAPPLEPARLQELRVAMRAVAGILRQARENLTGDARDLWYLGIRTADGEARALSSFAERADAHHPELAAEVRAARSAVEEFRNWLDSEYARKTGPSGVGVDDYDWHLKNVQLVPYTWAEELALVERELGRAWSYLSLAENRDRSRPPLQRVASAAEYQRLYRQAVSDFVQFLQTEQVMTLAGYEEQSLLAREGGFTPPDRPLEFFSEVNYRDLRPMRAHGTHWFDLARMEEAPHPSPIRRVPLLYNLWASRAEGLATGFEEMMMEAGFLDAPQVRQLVWVLLAQRAARALGELRMHANEFTLEEAAAFTVENTPNGWLTTTGNTVWREGQLYLEQPSYGTSYVIGKMQIDRLLADRRRQLGNQFSLRQFMDEFHGAGMIPVALIHWQMTGLDSEVKKLW